MNRNPTGYYRPGTIEEVVRLLSQPHITTALLSGGALRLASTDDLPYEAVVDLQAIGDLQVIETTADRMLRLGASVTLEAAARHDAVPLLLRKVLTRSLTWNRRNAITLGEAIEYPGQVAEVIMALLALEATVVFAMPETHRVPLAELALVVEQPKVPQRGLITAIEIPMPVPRQVWGQMHVARTPADEAIVSVAAVLVVAKDGVISRARLALTGVWPEPARVAEAASAALVGGRLDEAHVGPVLDVLDGEIAPVADYRGSVEYRRAMARVLTCRALGRC